MLKTLKKKRHLWRGTPVEIVGKNDLRWTPVENVEKVGEKIFNIGIFFFNKNFGKIFPNVENVGKKSSQRLKKNSQHFQQGVSRNVTFSTLGEIFPTFSTFSTGGGG